MDFNSTENDERPQVRRDDIKSEGIRKKNETKKDLFLWKAIKDCFGWWNKQSYWFVVEVYWLGRTANCARKTETFGSSSFVSTFERRSHAKELKCFLLCCKIFSFKEQATNKRTMWWMAACKVRRYTMDTTPSTYAARSFPQRPPDSTSAKQSSFFSISYFIFPSLFIRLWTCFHFAIYAVE